MITFQEIGSKALLWQRCLLLLLAVATLAVLFCFAEGRRFYSKPDPKSKPGHGHIVGSSANLNEEKMLIKEIMDNYTSAGKQGRPVRLINTTMRLEFGLTLIQIMNIDEIKQVLTLNVWCKYKWTDESLSWDPEEHDDIKLVRIPINSIWKPDLVLYNYADERLSEYRDVMALVTAAGGVTYIPPAIIKSTCAIDTTNFPFDEQSCSLKFGSWTYSGKALDPFFMDDKQYIELAEYVPSQEWIIVEHHATKNVQYYECCPDEPYPDLTFHLKVRRRGAFYSYTLILPCVLLSVITMVLFILPPEAPAKMMLGINLLSAFFMLLIMLRDTTPPASLRIPIIGAYYCFNMVMTTVSTFLCAVIVDMHFRADKKHPPSKLLTYIVIDILARALFIPIREGLLVGHQLQKVQHRRRRRRQKCHNFVDLAISLASPLPETENDAKGNNSKDCIVPISRLAVFVGSTVRDKRKSASNSSTTKRRSSQLKSPPLLPTDSFDQDHYNKFEAAALLVQPGKRPSTILETEQSTSSQKRLSNTQAALSSSNRLSVPISRQNSNRPSQATQEIEIVIASCRNSVELRDQINAEIRIIRRLMSKHSKRLKLRETKLGNIERWKIMSMVIDRIFFNVYIICMIVSLTILFPRPPSDLGDMPRYPNGTIITLADTLFRLKHRL